MTQDDDDALDLREIRQELDRLDMSGNDFASEAGINQSTFARILNGETTNPHPLTVRAINAALRKIKRRK